MIGSKTNKVRLVFRSNGKARESSQSIAAWSDGWLRKAGQGALDRAAICGQCASHGPSEWRASADIDRSERSCTQRHRRSTSRATGSRLAANRGETRNESGWTSVLGAWNNKRGESSAILAFESLERLRSANRKRMAILK